MRKPRVAFFSPLPPIPSGISEYSQDLLPELSKHLHVDLFVEKMGIGEELRKQFRVYEAKSFPSKASSYDTPVYQMGNNKYHLYLYSYIKNHPGITVFHDTVLHHFYVEATLACGDSAGYVRLMRKCYGDLGKRAAMSRIHDRYADRQYFFFPYADRQYFFFPLNEEIALKSRGIVVHNDHGRRELLRRIPNLIIKTIPMGIPRVVDALPSKESARAKLGLRQDSFVVGSFGFVTRIKRPEVLFKAMARIKHKVPGLLGLVVGEVSGTLGLQQEARNLGISDKVRFAGYIDRAEIPWYLASVDVFVNLRYPTAGETSASLLKLLSWGKPVIASGYQQFWDLPEEICPKVRPGAWEIESLSEKFLHLAGESTLRDRIGRAAQKYIQEKHSVKEAASQYAEFIRHVIDKQAKPLGPPSASSWVQIPWKQSRVPGSLRAELSHTGLPARTEADQKLCVGVRAENTGDTTWLATYKPYGGYVALGGILLRPDGTRELQQWVPIPHDVPPGQSFEAPFPFKAPRAPGKYGLLVDLVVAGLTWFHQRGSKALVFEFEVAPAI